MWQSILTAVGPILAGLVGLAAVIKVFLDKKNSTQQVAVSHRQVEVSADDVSVRSEANVLEGYSKLLAETREQFEDYREYTDKRIDQFASELKALREELAKKDDKIALLSIDRDTLIQHLLAGKGLPVPDLHTV